MAEYFNYKKAREYLGIKSINTLYQLIHSGLPTIEINKQKYIAKSDIDKFMADHRVVATQDK